MTNHSPTIFSHTWETFSSLPRHKQQQLLDELLRAWASLQSPIVRALKERKP